MPEIEDSLDICLLTTASELILTCTISNIYPDINLFFRRNSLEAPGQKCTPWENADGTKNKTVIVNAAPSHGHFPYECVASYSDIPEYDYDGEWLTFAYVSLPSQDVVGVTKMNEDDTHPDSGKSSYDQ